jgi:hypothetical protein
MHFHFLFSFVIIHRNYLIFSIATYLVYFVQHLSRLLGDGDILWLQQINIYILVITAQSNWDPSIINLLGIFENYSFSVDLRKYIIKRLTVTAELKSVFFICFMYLELNVVNFKIVAEWF